MKSCLQLYVHWGLKISSDHFCQLGKVASGSCSAVVKRKRKMENKFQQYISLRATEGRAKL